MEILGESGIQRLTSPLAKYERFAALVLISLIRQGIGADAFLWPRMFFKATPEVRNLAFYLDQQEGIDLIAVRLSEGTGLPIQVSSAGRGLTTFRMRHPEVPIVITERWKGNPPRHLKVRATLETARILTDSRSELWKSIHCERYFQMKDHLPWYLREQKGPE